MGFLTNLINSEQRHYSKAQKLQEKVLTFENTMSQCSDDELRNKTDEYKSRIAKGESLESLLPEAFATCREAAKRVLGEFPYPVQILGGVLLHFGDVAEMKTGEGKTLTATMPIYLNALEGKGAHVITVNEYLAARDAEWMGEVYRFLGLTVGVNLHSLSFEQKKDVYLCDITYSTNSELGFDYLRDNMAKTLEGRVQRGLHYAIIDEVDSVLIDESRTPLILSGWGDQLSPYYMKADAFAKSCRREQDVEIVLEDNAVTLTESGIKKAEKAFNMDHLYGSENAELIHYLQNALRANFLMSKDVEYVVQEDEIVLVDQFTGRKMEGREFSDGLHQAIQAKENVGIKIENKTLATITYQNFFRLYNKLSGMTGTAKTEEQEFLNTYNMRVYVIPTNRPIARVDYPDAIFKTKKEKYEAILNEVVSLYEKGQPVLVGTISIGMSENLSELLKKKGIPHQVLNAKEDAKEAHIVAEAGRRKTVTIATNMAGRGTDIKLGEGVVELGGLVVLGSERHESKRIDNQLRGRSGRQGDPGYSRFFVSMEDDLVEKFATDYMKETIDDYESDKVSEDKMRKLVDSIQERAEGLHFDSRKNVLEYDDVLMEQRRMVYSQRDEILAMEEITELVESLYVRVIERLALSYNQDKTNQNRIHCHEQLKRLKVSEEAIEEGFNQSDKAKNIWIESALSNYRQIYPDNKTIEKIVFLTILDRQWMDHVDNMDRLKKGIYLRQYASVKPIDAYKEESIERFENMMDNITEQTIFTLTSQPEKQEEA
ncbi:preprotein translocase subunit SecA [Anaerorhabdus furcosa]|uniref:Protein translocase subunit SecA n=1 Tax=Anaerorhabdus furcosa TaxID=118967 RepID=A0A1T4K4J1_9FIRM|nr:preprotein translocase subunit SecA [Anaerorhabdus furcosa]SJZ37360.1 preprotein translocase subunit SecA [Anaerorhabdus furcosa]